MNQEFSKTHAERYIPVSQKLKKILTNDAMENEKGQCAVFQSSGRKQESPFQKRYNKAVKKKYKDVINARFIRGEYMHKQ